MLHAVSSTANRVLRVYPQVPRDCRSGLLVSEQLPYLKNLRQKIELITGWKIDFAESTNSYRARQGESRTTVMGALAVEDMSFDRLPGMGIVPRSEVESLVRTLDQMLRVIQADRHAREEFSTRVDRVVNPLSPQWKFHGISGTHLGDLVSWLPGENGCLYALSAQLEGEADVELSSASRSLQSVFRAGVAAGLSLSRLNSMLEFHLSELPAEVKLAGLTVVELAPKSGQYQWFQLGQQRTAFRLDFEAATVTTLELTDVDSEGASLGSHELILLGDPNGESMASWLDCRADSQRNRCNVLHQLDHLPAVSPCLGMVKS